MIGFPKTTGPTKVRVEHQMELEDGSIAFPILDDAQDRFLRTRKNNAAKGVEYCKTAAEGVVDNLEHRMKNPEWVEVTSLKNSWRDSILSFKHKDAVFRRYDGEFFARSFEPCVSGRIFDYPYMVEGKPHLVFQTDRGHWYVPCKSEKHLKRMVSPYRPGPNGRCANHLRKMHQSYEANGGEFFDEISGLPPGTRVNADNGFTLPWGETRSGADRYYAVNIDWTAPMWSEPTPWEVSCA